MSTPGAGCGAHPGDGADLATGVKRRLVWAGDRAWLLDCPTLGHVMAVRDRLHEHPLPGQVELVPAARTVFVSFDTPHHAALGACEVLTWQIEPGLPSTQRVVELPVSYTGENLAEVARYTGLSPEAVIAIHTSTAWSAAFGGFAPGFMYLTPSQDSADHRWEVPRRESPRTSVPAGSVGLAGTLSAVYPRSSPGGWQLIGHTDAVLWDEHADPPATIRPGDTVRFTAVRDSVRASVSSRSAAEHGAVADAPDQSSCPGDARPDAAQPGKSLSGHSPPSNARTLDPRPGDSPADAQDSASAAETAPSLVLEHAGLQTLVQDRGRPGFAALGVPTSGAADRRSADRANRLVGNPAQAAVLENLMGNAVLRAVGHHVLALTGARVAAWLASAPGAENSHGPDKRPVPLNTPFPLYHGESLHLGPVTAGLRTYVGVRGGVLAEPTLGSRSTDTLSDLGPRPLRAGDMIPVDTPRNPATPVGAPERTDHVPDPGQAVTLRIRFGPREEWFTPAAQRAVTDRPWTVSSDSDRIGVRFEAETAHSEGGSADVPLPRARTGELASEAVASGSLQVPPSGAPVLFLADHPVTGGYPVIAVVVAEDLDLAAQLPPGTPVRFAALSADDAAASSSVPEAKARVTTAPGEVVPGEVVPGEVVPGEVPPVNDTTSLARSALLSTSVASGERFSAPTLNPVAVDRGDRVLVDHRGAMAVRMIRSLRDAGLHSVVRYPPGEIMALYARLADEAHAAGPGTPATAGAESAASSTSSPLPTREPVDPPRKTPHSAPPSHPSPLSPQEPWGLPPHTRWWFIRERMGDSGGGGFPGRVRVLGALSVVVGCGGRALVVETLDLPPDSLTLARAQRAADEWFAAADAWGVAVLEVGERPRWRVGPDPWLAVVEEATGEDLVRAHVAAVLGRVHPLPQLPTRNRMVRGYAIRAEDPALGFVPLTGTVRHWRPPGGPGVRVDEAVHAGDSVVDPADPLLATLVVSGRDRGEVLRRSRRALDEFDVAPLPTLLSLHRELIRRELAATAPGEASEGAAAPAPDDAPGQVPDEASKPVSSDGGLPRGILEEVVAQLRVTPYADPVPAPDRVTLTVLVNGAPVSIGLPRTCWEELGVSP